MQLTHTPIMAPVALPNLHRFTFRGFITYSEALIHQIITPHLEKLQIDFFFNQLTFSVPRLLQFVHTTETLRFRGATFEFSDESVHVRVYPHEADVYSLSIVVDCWHLDWQVSSAAQIFNAASPVFSAVEHLTLEHGALHSRSSEEHNEADPTEWRKLLSLFRNVKTFRIGGGLVEELSRCLQSDDGEPPLELLPELQELTYSGSGNTGDIFNSFIIARQNADRPITLVRRSPSPNRRSSMSSFHPSLITPASGLAESGPDV
jgi:hypothetical protein